MYPGFCGIWKNRTKVMNVTPRSSTTLATSRRATYAVIRQPLDEPPDASPEPDRLSVPDVRRPRRLAARCGLRRVWPIGRARPGQLARNRPAEAAVWPIGHARSGQLAKRAPAAAR